MKITPINCQTQNTNFKSAFPVAHWVTEGNGKYAPVAGMKLAETLQGKLVRMLNKPLEKSTKPMVTLEQSFRAYIAQCDPDYRVNQQVRSFYNRTERSTGNAVSYITTGESARKLGLRAKEIGPKKHQAKELTGDTHSPEVDAAVKEYNRYGLNFVKDPLRQIRDSQGKPYTLCTKFQILRNKLGIIKGYKFIEARFVSQDGRQLGKMKAVNA